MERWLQVDEFPRYQVSDQGRIMNIDTERVMSMVVNAAGVLAVYLVRDGTQYSRGVAKLVASHFLPHSTDMNSAPMHRNGDRTDNRAENLVWRPRWYAIKYLRQFEEYRPPYVHVPVKEMESGLVFPNSWEATQHFGLLEYEIAKSFHMWEANKELYRASPTNLHFRRDE